MGTSFHYGKACLSPHVFDVYDRVFLRQLMYYIITDFIRQESFAKANEEEYDDNDEMMREKALSDNVMMHGTVIQTETI